MFPKGSSHNLIDINYLDVTFIPFLSFILWSAYKWIVEKVIAFWEFFKWKLSGLLSTICMLYLATYQSNYILSVLQTSTFLTIAWKWVKFGWKQSPCDISDKIDVLCNYQYLYRSYKGFLVHKDVSWIFSLWSFVCVVHLLIKLVGAIFEMRLSLALCWCFE